MQNFETLWQGLSASAQQRMTLRDYQGLSLEERLRTEGVEGGQVLAAEAHLKAQGVWIPGVELFARTIYLQKHRGHFGELCRQEENPLSHIGLWPTQWSCARMFAHTAKGFHIHPPYVPEGWKPESWFQRLFLQESEHYALRLYDQEQWDVLFILQGKAEILLIDERAGLERHQMRFSVEGDEFSGSNHLGVVIPPGVAHALRTEGSGDLLMVYGTSTVFQPHYEGRMAAEVEQAPLPSGWKEVWEVREDESGI